MTPDKTRRIVISSPERLRLALKVVSELDPAEVWEVTAKPFRRQRSLEQNACYHGWAKVISEHFGQEPEEFKEEAKQRWLVPILERDDEEFREMLEAYRAMYQAGQKDKAVRLADLLKKRVSTTWLSVTQFKELLDNMEKFAESYGIVLPKKEQYEERH